MTISKRVVATPNGEEILLEALMGFPGGGSGAIERQEARGQQSLVQSDTLPTDMGHGAYGAQTRAALEKAGVVFGAVVEDDPLFTYVTLPKGWTKRATDHAMWSDLLDERGRKRASIGYKAAFYDRWASLSATRRFDVTRYAGTEAAPRAEVQDCGKPVHVIAFAGLPDDATREDQSAYYERGDAALQACVDWLVANGRPDWQDAGAYWDEAAK